MRGRLNNLSLYRIAASLLILQFHIFYILYDRDIPYELLLSKLVQGLTALSGFLYAKRKIENSFVFIAKALKKLIPPAIVCFIVMAVWNLVYMLFSGGNYLSLFLDRRAYDGSVLMQAGNYYYILYIFICYLLTPILARGKRARHTVAIITFLCELALAYFFDIAIIATAYIVGYLVGVKNQDAYILPSRSPREPIFWTVVAALFFGIYSLSLRLGFSDYPMVRLSSLLGNLGSAGVGTASFFLIALLVKFLNRKDGIAPFKYTDKLSLNIYLFNQAYMCGAMNVTRWTHVRPIGILLVYVFTILSAVFVTNLIPLLSILIFHKKKIKN